MALAFVAGLASASPVAAEVLVGTARLVDGDTLYIGERGVRLHGIDAPELGQKCTRDNGALVRCGKLALEVLAGIIGGSETTCEGSTSDDYGRLLARCRADDRDLNALMVERGWALAFVKYSDDFVAQEEVARGQRQGMFATVFEPPWEFRRARWEAAGSVAPDPACPIKGNISRDDERIYHLPWGRDYDRTRIDISRGERWFCSEKEATEAGWRLPR